MTIAWIRRRPIAIAALVLLGGCATADEGGRRSNGTTADDRMFTMVFDQIADKYLESINIGSVATAALANLSRVDPHLSIKTEDRRIELFEDDHLVTDWALPAKDEPGRWASLASAIVDAGRAASPTLRAAAPEVIYQAVFDGAVTKLDRFSRYTTAEAAREGRASREGFGGIGITVDVSANGVRVISVIPDSPASRANLRPEDVITKIDDVPAQGLAQRDAVQKLRGRIGSSVILTIEGSNRPVPIRLTLRRSHIVPPTVSISQIDDVAHIRVTGFSQGTADAVDEALRRAKAGPSPVRGVILDLRGNLGGLLDQAIALSEVFVADGSIVSMRGRHRDSSATARATPGGSGESLPVVILIDGRSASASEIVAAALQDNRRAVVVGSVSFGKGSVQTVIDLPNEGELILSWARFHAPSGYALQDLGVMPAICTSGIAGDPANAVEEARHGRFTNAVAFNRWRMAGLDSGDKGRFSELRGQCPPMTGDRDLDLDIARRVLADRTLFGNLLIQSAQEATLR